MRIARAAFYLSLLSMIYWAFVWPPLNRFGQHPLTRTGSLAALAVFLVSLVVILVQRLRSRG